jgi:hypothetical protein
VDEANNTVDTTDTPDTPDSYIIEHATTALACDPRVGALDIQITVEHGRVTAHGTVETEARRAAIESVLTELLPHHQIMVAVVVSQTPTDEPTVEELP